MNRATVTADETTRAVCMVSDELAAVLRQYGHDPDALNVIRWPVGASRWATGTLLLSRSALNALETAGLDSGVDITITDDDGNTVTLEGMYLLAPRPLLVGQGEQLFAVPVVCQRWRWRALATADYNRRISADPVGYDPATLDNGEPWTWDDVLADLSLPVTPTVDDDDEGTAIDVFGIGRRAAEVADEILGVTGRVYVLHVDGTATVEHVDARTVYDVLSVRSGRVVSGGISYAVGSPTGWLSNITLPAGWRDRDVPATVSVSMGDQLAGANARAARIVTPTITATTQSLTGAAGPVRVLNTHHWTTDETSTDDVAIADAYATAFYRRFAAGAMDVEIAGVANPVLGGSCQEVVWSLCGRRGFRTRLIARLDWIGYPWREDPADTLGSGVQVLRTPYGREVARAGTDLYLEITGAAPTGTDVWAYAAKQVYLADGAGQTWNVVAGGVEFATDGSTPRLINLREVHPSDTVWGNQVDTATDVPDGGSLTLRAIADGTIVRAWPQGAADGSAVWVFDVANGMTVECGS